MFLQKPNILSHLELATKAKNIFRNNKNYFKKYFFKAQWILLFKK